MTHVIGARIISAHEHRCVHLFPLHGWPGEGVAPFQKVSQPRRVGVPFRSMFNVLRINNLVGGGGTASQGRGQQVGFEEI